MQDCVVAQSSGTGESRRASPAAKLPLFPIRYHITMTALLAEAYFHTLDPWAVEFPAAWPIPGIRWYGLAYAVGFLIAWWFVRWVAKRGWSPLPLEKVGD